jgi:hypothetical protein
MTSNPEEEKMRLSALVLAFFTASAAFAANPAYDIQKRIMSGMKKDGVNLYEQTGCLSKDIDLVVPTGLSVSVKGKGKKSACREVGPMTSGGFAVFRTTLATSINTEDENTSCEIKFKDNETKKVVFTFTMVCNPT